MKLRRAIKMAKRDNQTRTGQNLIRRKETVRTIKRLGGEHGYMDRAYGSTSGRKCCK